LSGKAKAGAQKMLLPEKVRRILKVQKNHQAQKAVPK